MSSRLIFPVDRLLSRFLRARIAADFWLGSSFSATSFECNVMPALVYQKLILFLLNIKKLTKAVQKFLY